MTTADPSHYTRHEDAGILVFEGVGKQYRRPVDDISIDALIDIDFRVGPDECVGIIGPNGAGKTTILKLAAGVTAPSSGTIRRSKRALAVIELGAGIHTDLSGRENIELLMSLTMDRSLRTPTRFADIVDFSELAHVLDQPTRHYSSGMIARLAFSVAAHSDPELLLIDEVLSVGDLAFQQRCRDRIFELRSMGTTVVVVSHDLELIAAVCDRTILVVAGEIELDGATESVIDHYLDRPGVHHGRGNLSMRLAKRSMETGQELQVEVDVPDVPDATGLRIEYMIPNHVELRAEQGNSVLCGTAWLPVTGSGPRWISLVSAGLPTGRYELHIALEDSSRAVLHSNVVPFTLLGPPGPVAIRLEPSVTVDGAPVEMTT